MGGGIGKNEDISGGKSDAAARASKWPNPQFWIEEEDFKDLIG